MAGEDVTMQRAQSFPGDMPQPPCASDLPVHDPACPASMPVRPPRQRVPVWLQAIAVVLPTVAALIVGLPIRVLFVLFASVDGTRHLRPGAGRLELFATLVYLSGALTVGLLVHAGITGRWRVCIVSIAATVLCMIGLIVTVATI